ncbi:glycosyltransferase [Sinorhizobium meliloti]|uniref:glycosyltransferase family 2 protein n=1 Tax=Rhizobium meliloti TaxID=382 RepID=UPI00307F7540
MPRVSVVIPCSNYGHYLRQCVDKVTRNQPGIEDDKSTDDRIAVARSIKDRDERVRHIATYNDGLDGDDAGALTRAAELLVAEPSVGAVYGDAFQRRFACAPHRWKNLDYLVGC